MRRVACLMLTVLAMGSAAHGQLVVADGDALLSAMWLIDVSGGGRPNRQLTSGLVNVNGLTSDNDAGILYWTSFVVNSNALFSAPVIPSGFLTPSAGVLTNLGATNTEIDGLAWDSTAHMLIGTGFNGDLYQINPATGALTLLWTAPTNVSLGGLDYDPATDAFYAANDGISVVAPFVGPGLYRINKPLTSPTFTKLASYPAPAFDVDGLAVGNGRVYLVSDDSAEPIYVYNLSSNVYETSLTTPLTGGADRFAAGAWAPGLYLPVLTRDVAEMEPNDSKIQATCVSNLSDGEGFSGLAGVENDFFLVDAAHAAPGIYRHTLTLSSATPGHVMRLRGLAQTSGVVNFGSDVFVQTAMTDTTTLDRRVQWYDFGSRGRVFCSVGGAVATTEKYRAVHGVTPIVPTDIGTFLRGSISFAETGALAWDTDYWVYDSNFHSIPGFGHDQPDATPMSRIFGAGVYYLAIGRYNFANDQISPTDDADRSSPVMDFEGVAMSQQSSVQSGTETVAITNNGVTQNVLLVQSEPFEVKWLKFTVVDPCAGDFNGNGVKNVADIFSFLSAWFAGCP